MANYEFASESEDDAPWDGGDDDEYQKWLANMMKEDPPFATPTDSTLEQAMPEPTEQAAPTQATPKEANSMSTNSDLLPYQLYLIRGADKRYGGEYYCMPPFETGQMFYLQTPMDDWAPGYYRVSRVDVIFDPSSSLFRIGVHLEDGTWRKV